MAPLPVGKLHGVGPATVKTIRYGHRHRLGSAGDGAGEVD
ncbi:MAG: hypothetical protein M0Z85_06100 [Gammaproteobacteria bacterium]|nr:hypothetical protein [Acidithiobacillus ferrianus]MDA8119617.1 hypothetical protein [Gammaproteobacteria bacterium]